jgi:chaperonin GroES
MKVRPLQDRVLVKPLEEKETKKGGIIIPDSAKEKPMEGKVIAVGIGKLSESGVRLPLEVKKGNKVIFGKYAGTEIKLDGDDYLLMKEDDIQGIID